MAPRFKMPKPGTPEFKTLGELYLRTPWAEIYGIAEGYGVTADYLRKQMSMNGVRRAIPVSVKTRMDNPPKLKGSQAIMPDAHCPYQDKELIDRTVDLAQAWGIKSAVLAGDTFEMAAFSVFQNRPSETAEVEIEEGHKFLLSLSDAFENVLLLKGNHDNRFFHLVREQLTVQHFLRMFDAPPNIKMSEYAQCIVGTGRGKAWHINHPRNASVIPGRVPFFLSRKRTDYNIAGGHGHQWGMVATEDEDCPRLAIDIGMCGDPKRMDWQALWVNTRPPMQQGCLLLKEVDGYYFAYPLHKKFTDWKALRRLYSP